ncbi:MAG: homoserine dehydrogenase [Peptococcaceae bacterium]|nr:homoserine dehydrogenase [Peptococcaceae bacterium]
MERSIIKVALLGMGTVGSGVYEVIEHLQKDNFIHKVGAEVQIKYVLVRSPEKYAGQVAAHTTLTTRWQDILADEEVSVIVEVMGGIEPARTYLTEALRAGKNIVSANKDLIAVHGQELQALAAEMKRDFRYEASCLGAIPIVQPLKENMAANHFTELVGIMNGTTNYILTNMAEKGLSFEEALAEATALGYAEADPTADVEGLDAGRKVAILANIAFHTPAVFDDVHVEGITKISKLDMAYADSIGCVVKLLGIATKQDDGLCLRVHPAILAKSHPLANVGGSFNAVFVQGDAIDEAMFYGRGAGKLPTASAVVGDVIDICRDIVYGSEGRIGDYTYERIPIKPMSQMKSRFYVRLRIPDRPRVLGEVGMLFGDSGVSIAQAKQKNSTNSEDAEFIIITHEVLEEKFNEALERLNNTDSVRQVENVIRIYGGLPQ